MTAITHAVGETGTMVRRNLKHAIRTGYITMTVGIPIIILLLFVYVFGDTLGSGLIGGGGIQEYLKYIVPGILVLTIAMGGQMTAISVSQDMTEGIVARFRTMAMSRSAVLWGHVIGNTIQHLIAMAIVLGGAVLMGLRPSADLGGWLLAAGALVLITLAMNWFCLALGMQAKTVETASNLPMPLMLLTFLGSGFVPTSTIPEWLRWFAEYQPFTPFNETVRAYLLGTELGSYGWQTLAWSFGIFLAGYFWARGLYERRSLR